MADAALTIGFLATGALVIVVLVASRARKSQGQAGQRAEGSGDIGWLAGDVGINCSTSGDESGGDTASDDCGSDGGDGGCDGGDGGGGSD